MGNYGWHDGGVGLGGWVVMAVFMLLFWAGVIAVVITLLRHSARGRDEHTTAQVLEDPAIRILEESFARREIDAEEFTRRRDLLRPRR